MTRLDLTILYVEDTLASATFYEGLLGTPPVEASPGFAMFRLPGGGGLGLWARRGVVPEAGAPGGGELCFVSADVDAAHADWAARGIRIAQAPTGMEFGRCFVGLDPDGHRLRVFRPAEG